MSATISSLESAMMYEPHEEQGRALMDMEAFSRAVRRRGLNGLSRNDLARHLGCTAETLASWQRNSVVAVNPKSLFSVCAALSIPPAEVIHHSTEGRPDPLARIQKATKADMVSYLAECLKLFESGSEMIHRSDVIKDPDRQNKLAFGPRELRLHNGYGRYELNGLGSSADVMFSIELRLARYGAWVDIGRLKVTERQIEYVNYWFTPTVKRVPRSSEKVPVYLWGGQSPSAFMVRAGPTDFSVSEPMETAPTEATERKIDDGTVVGFKASILYPERYTIGLSPDSPLVDTGST